MKKINSITYGHRILAMDGCLLFVIPLLLGLANRIVEFRLANLLVNLSLILGLLTAVVFLILLAVEFWQDRQCDRIAARERRNSFYTKNHQMECQNCGCLFGSVQSKACPGCGITFTNIGGTRMDQILESLFIPLLVRAKESKRKIPLFVDTKAVEMVEQTIHTQKFDGGTVSEHGILARTVVIDQTVQKLLAEHPNSVVLNLGAGLDSRRERLGNVELVAWYDLDLPEVIALRRQYFVEAGQIRCIAKSVLDETWTEEVFRNDNQQVIIIAEGLLMYFSEEDVKQIFALLAAHFKNAYFIFDAVHPYFVGKGISSTFLWGIEKPEKVLQMGTGMKLVQAWATGNLLKKRQSTLLRALNWISSTRNRSQIILIYLPG